MEEHGHDYVEVVALRVITSGPVWHISFDSEPGDKPARRFVWFYCRPVGYSAPLGAMLGRPSSDRIEGRHI